MPPDFLNTLIWSAAIVALAVIVVWGWTLICARLSFAETYAVGCWTGEGV